MDGRLTRTVVPMSACPFLALLRCGKLVSDVEYYVLMLLLTRVIRVTC
jgi:hypothetical protein